jgi:hypothetical protein
MTGRLVQGVGLKVDGVGGVGGVEAPSEGALRFGDEDDDEYEDDWALARLFSEAGGAAVDQEHG